ncbi:MAG: DUF1080 domain-containing protein [Planctomycetota bacterium]|nr:MAG: DUF1080 domain-containing protein [Planctomycetota bacterium]REJ89426.1 MAG: DUF1080 domain-containing protein [Planctomycetota bacterium]REK26217.1 MAG: DUF1080 domain-containing protein [Planctomycetota bacterium]REK44563.1 MAG: DUF1080 domain-containing protein [Planctomycetota bacterium]
MRVGLVLRARRHSGWLLVVLVLCALVAFARAEETLTSTDGPPIENRLTTEELAAGWIQLFDGGSLYGWRAASDAPWRVVEGAIMVDQGEPGLLHTTTQFADFELKLDFQADAETNSGIFLRTSPRPNSPTDGCYELNIARPEVSPFPTGSFVGRKMGSNNNFDGQWHQYHVRAVGGQFRVYLDGELSLEYEDPRPLGRGFIGLQLNEGRVAFRNIKLKPLGTESIFNGRDLAGWKIFPDKQSEFSVVDGALRMVGGPGQLETERQWGDFILQTEIRVDGDELNSGIFFRSMPGEYQMGYESQIHNGMVDGDRNRPSNFGTGGIFRRQPARLIMARDREWFHKTIVCEGNHMAVWVSGVQVCDWTDRRDANENPRKGLRLEKGTIILQGHDPTTDLRFREIRAVELAPRRASR